VICEVDAGWQLATPRRRSSSSASGGGTVGHGAARAHGLGRPATVLWLARGDSLPWGRRGRGPALRPSWPRQAAAGRAPGRQVHPHGRQRARTAFVFLLGPLPPCRVGSSGGPGLSVTGASSFAVQPTTFVSALLRILPRRAAIPDLSAPSVRPMRSAPDDKKGI
jgi:hypothetical protein